MFIGLDFAARSDIGLVRTNNQDSGFAGPHLLVVADGMGGAAGGDVASSVAVGRLAMLDGEAHGPEDALDALKEAIAEAHAEICERARNEPELSGLGTTVTALLRSGSTMSMAHIGDSRAYLLRDGKLDQVTTDHSFVQHLVDTGRISQADAANHPKRSMLLRVLGDIDADVPVDISARETKPGDRWMLCSDGLSSVVSRPTLVRTMTRYADPADCADELLSLALAGGAPDNVTCIVADVVDIDKSPGKVGPPTASKIVGAAASTDGPSPGIMDRPMISAAAKAAALAAPPKYANPDALDVDRPWWKRWLTAARPWVLPAVGTLVVFVLTLAGYTWTQQQYYVGEADGQVAIYRGIPQDLGPLRMSGVVQQTGIDLSELAAFEQESIRGAIQAGSLAEAWEIVDELEGSG